MTLSQLTNRIVDWFVTVREIGRLQALDDRSLKDMGIERKKIPRLVKGR